MEITSGRYAASEKAIVAYPIADLVIPITTAQQMGSVLQPGQFFLEAAQALPGFDQLVGDRERRHHGEPHVADLAELCPQLADAAVEVAGEPDQMVLLAIIAGHAVLPSVDGDAHMSHDALPDCRAGTAVVSLN